MLISGFIFLAVCSTLFVLFFAGDAEADWRARMAAQATEQARNESVAANQESVIAQIAQQTNIQLAALSQRIEEARQVVLTSASNPMYQEAFRLLQQTNQPGPWNTGGPSGNATGKSATFGDIQTGMQGGSPGVGPGSSGTPSEAIPTSGSQPPGILPNPFLVGTPGWWSYEISARDIAAKSNTVYTPVSQSTPGYAQYWAPPPKVVLEPSPLLMLYDNRITPDKNAVPPEAILQANAEQLAQIYFLSPAYNPINQIYKDSISAANVSLLASESSFYTSWLKNVSEGLSKSITSEITRLDENLSNVLSIKKIESTSPISWLENFSISSIESFAMTAPFLISVPYGVEWVIRNPIQSPSKAVEILAGTGKTILERESIKPGTGAGTIVGMYIGGAAIGSIIPETPIKYGEFRIPIEAPEGLPKTEMVTKPVWWEMPVEVKVDGSIVYKMENPTVEAAKSFTKTEPINYEAVYKGLYFDTNIRTPLGQVGNVYGGKVPLVGSLFEPGGKLLQGIGDSKIIGSAIESARRIPGAAQIIERLESRPEVLTGLWFGPESIRSAGGALKSRVSGTVDFLNDYAPALQIQRLEALEGIISKADSDYVRSIITLRDITSSGKVKLQQVEPYGIHSPVTMKPETFEAIKEYINANPEDIRLYGSLVGKVYLGKSGRSTLGDVDALMKSSRAQEIADSLWDIYLKGEFGEGSYKVRSTETKILNAEGKTHTDILREALTPGGDLLSKLETGSSQITGHRIMGLTPTGEHALDLHPIENLKYNSIIEGTTVKTIPIEDLIWGKQTIGNPPIGTVTISRTGTEAVVDVGGRVKDLYDTRSFAAKAAEISYLNKKYWKYAEPLENSFKVLNERLSGVEQSQHIRGYPEGITLETFQREFVNPLESPEVKLAKIEMRQSIKEKVNQYLTSAYADMDTLYNRDYFEPPAKKQMLYPIYSIKTDFQETKNIYQPYYTEQIQYGEKPYATPISEYIPKSSSYGSTFIEYSIKTPQIPYTQPDYIPPQNKIEPTYQPATTKYTTPYSTQTPYSPKNLTLLTTSEITNIDTIRPWPITPVVEKKKSRGKFTVLPWHPQWESFYVGPKLPKIKRSPDLFRIPGKYPQTETFYVGPKKPITKKYPSVSSQRKRR